MLISRMAVIAAALSIPAISHAQEITPSFTGIISQGDFGSQRDTVMGSALLGVQAEWGDTSVKVTLPYIATRSPGIVFSGFDGTPLVMVPDLGGPKRVWDGFGDPTVSVSHVVRTGGFEIRGTGRAKIAVQDINEVSTGESDFAVSAEVSKVVGGVVPFASVGYRWFGDPEGWDIRDGFAASAGVAAPIGEGSAAVSYQFAERTSDFVGDAHEIVAAYDAPLPDSPFRLAAIGTLGLSSGAPDFSAGLRVSMKF